MFGNKFWIAYPAYMDWLNAAVELYGERTFQNWLMYQFVLKIVRKKRLRSSSQTKV